MAAARSPWSPRTVLLGVTGSIAAYKACDLLRRLKERGADVHCLMSAGAQKFVTPLLLGALSGRPVATELWDASLWKASHLDLAERADLFLIAPASANALARLAQGAADELIGATYLACRAPVLIAPAMHEQMWRHPAVQENVRVLKGRGARFVGPEFGALSQGTNGWGRFADTETILKAAETLLRKK